MTSGDFAHSETAAANRAAKARELAVFCWDRALDADDVCLLDEETRRALAREAGVSPPSTGETWDAVRELLNRKADWARAHPEHPKAGVAYPRGRARWVRGARP